LITTLKELCERETKTFLEWIEHILGWGGEGIRDETVLLCTERYLVGGIGKDEELVEFVSFGEGGRGRQREGEGDRERETRRDEDQSRRSEGGETQTCFFCSNVLPFSELFLIEQHKSHS
jgi:hypothetical protein